jgi:putative PEP-CTERM system histidine kinase
LDLTSSVTPAVVSYTTVAVVYAALSLQLSLRWRRETRATWFLASVVLGAIWGATCAAYAVTRGAGFWAGAEALDVLRYGSLFGFTILILERGGIDGRAGRGATFGRAALGVVLLGAALWAHLPIPGAGESESGSPSVLFLGPPIYGLVLVEQLYRQTDPQLRWNVRPLCLGLAGLYAFDLVMFSDAVLFRALDLNFWSARGFAHALVIPLLGIAAARNNEWRFAVTVSRSILAGSTALFASGSYLLVVAALGFYVRDFGGDWGRTLQTVLLFAAVLFLLLVLLSGTFRSQMRVLVAKHFYAQRYDYREEWLRFARTLAMADSGQSIHQLCVRALADLVESPGGGIWLEAPGGGFAQVARIGQARVDAAEPASGPFVQFLARTGWVLETAEVRRQNGRFEQLPLPPWLDALADAWLVVPLTTGERLLGFVVLSQPRVKVEIDWEVRDLLKAAGRQAASYVAQYQASEALLEARKFDAFNRMSAFVVHDLKNLVAQLQLLLRNAQRHHDNPEFQADMLKTVEHVVGRMNHLMLQLRSGTDPVELARPVEMATVIEQVRAAHAADGIRFEAAATRGIFALGHEDRLVRVIGHLVQNAIDAVRDNPRVGVTLARDNDKVVVEVSDNGVGMPSEFVRDSLFKPFRTTKSKGMGIGAYESHQYVTSLGGSIEVTSAVNQGTCVRVVLPAASVGAVAEAVR